LVLIVYGGLFSVQARFASGSRRRCQMMTRMERPTATRAYPAATSSGDASVAFPEEGVGPARRVVGLAERGGQIPVAVPGGPVALLPSGGFL